MRYEVLGMVTKKEMVPILFRLMETKDNSFLNFENRVCSAEYCILNFESKVCSAEYYILNFESRVRSAEYCILNFESRVRSAEYYILNFEKLLLRHFHGKNELMDSML